MIIYNPNKFLTLIIAMTVQFVSLYIMVFFDIEPYTAVIVSIIIFISYLIIHSYYYRKINNELISKYINEYNGETSAIKYFRKTVYARRNKLSKKEIIYNDELRQIPKFLQAKNLHSKTMKKMENDYIKLKVLAPYFYKNEFINLILISTVSKGDVTNYIEAIKEEYLDGDTENILLFYLNNLSQEEYMALRRQIYVNNYLIDNISVKITFLIKNDNGFTLLNNYYFVDYSTCLIKDKYKIKYSLPIPCDILSKRVYNEIYFKLCGK